MITFNTSASEYVTVDNSRVPVNIEGINYLISRMNAMQLDYNSLVDEIHELEHNLKLAKREIKSLKFDDEYFIMDKDGN